MTSGGHWDATADRHWDATADSGPCMHCPPQPNANSPTGPGRLRRLIKLGEVEAHLAPPVGLELDLSKPLVHADVRWPDKSQGSGSTHVS